MEKHFFSVEAVHLGHIPVTEGKLFHHSAIEKVEVDVVVTASLGSHQEAVAILEEGPVIGDVDVIGIEFIVEHAALPRRGVGGQNFQMVLVAVEALDGEDVGILGPLHARQVDVGLDACVHLHGCAAGQVVDVDFHDAVVFACLGIFEAVPIGIEAFELFHLELFHVRLVELHIGNLLAVGRPAVALRETEFLLIDPVGGTINYMIVQAIVGELNFLTRLQVFDKQIVIAHEANLGGIR